MNNPNLRFKPFFVHQHIAYDPKFRAIKNAPIGFTLYISASEHPHKVLVSGAWCSHKDRFTKSVGRNQAKYHAEIKEINARHLHRLLNGMWQVIHGREATATGDMDFHYVYKYMV